MKRIILLVLLSVSCGRNEPSVKQFSPKFEIICGSKTYFTFDQPQTNGPFITFQDVNGDIIECENLEGVEIISL